MIRQMRLLDLLTLLVPAATVLVSAAEIAAEQPSPLVRFSAMADFAN